MKLAAYVEVSILAVMLCLISFTARVQAQEKASMAAPQLNDQEKRGQAVFLQRCSLCHLPKIETPNPKPLKSYGPSLKGMIPKDADTDQLSFFKQFIMTGTDRMPGFQYGLKPNEIDDVIAFLQTL